MPKGLLTVNYELAIPDFEVADAGPIAQDIQRPATGTITMKPTATGLELEIQVQTEDPNGAAETADSIARELAEHFTFWLCEHDVSHKVVAKKLGPPEFGGSVSNTLHVFLGELIMVGHAVVSKVTRRVKKESIATALAEFSIRQQAPPPVTATDLIVARQMFLAGLGVENRVASFLISYAALAALAAFLRGSGRQATIDALLRSEDPSLLTVTRTDAAGKTTSETEFTAARNVFIHSEDRGRAPAAAMAAVESLAARFNVLVGRIFRKA